MASPILHIKDSYYFEVPKGMARSGRKELNDFPEFWVRLDPDFQLWQAEHIYESLHAKQADIPAFGTLKSEFTAWQHTGHNFGKPFAKFLNEAPGQEWFREKSKDPKFAADWNAALAGATVAEYKASGAEWSTEKVSEYNRQLDGKIIIPQPFGELKNLYEPYSGFCISRFMIIELAVAAVAVFIFVRLAQKMQKSNVPRGRMWNFFESMLLFVRDQVARPAIGGHDADKFVPLLWTIFFFVLFCNLSGMLPWLGAPTGSWSTTTGLAFVTFATVLIAGMLHFGVFGFWKNQVPHMDLPPILAVLIIPLIFVIEVVGLVIRHAVLSVRLLANMVAGHVVLLGIMTIAFSVEGAMSDWWGLAAVISIVSSVLFSCLELFVAFLQAYIFTFLSALFIGAAIHHH